MRVTPWLAVLLLLPVLVLPAIPADPLAKEDDTPVKWKKTVIDTAFRSEGVAIGDINKDGKMDIIAGDVWYEAPDWKIHEFRPAKDYRNGDNNVYSKCMACWVEDVNGDGWLDIIVIGFPGEPAYWYENPQNKEGHWKQHEIWHSACNETPQFVDLLGTGKRVLVMGWQPKGKETEGQMAWFSPGKDPTELWEMHPISEPSKPGSEMPGTRKFSHGLGVGDINGDGRLDVLCTDGWWEQPEKPDGVTPWKLHKAKLSESCADMFAYATQGDGKADVISSSAHGIGIWAYLQKPGKDGAPEFLKTDLFPKLVSQTHAMHCVDINGDGLKDLVTGKRWWAHGPKGDVNPTAPATLYWFEARKDKDGIVTFIPHLIDDDSGIGTQFVVADFNGDKLPDIVVANKKGVFLFEQFREKK